MDKEQELIKRIAVLERENRTLKLENERLIIKQTISSPVIPRSPYPYWNTGVE